MTMNMNKLMSSMMCKVNSIVIDMNGNFAVSKNGKVYTYKNDVVEETIAMMDNLPVYAMFTKPEDAVTGDVVVIREQPYGWLRVIESESKEYSYELMHIDGRITSIEPTKNLLNGSLGFLIVKNMFTNENNGGLFGNMNPMMLAMLMDEKGNSDGPFEKMLMMNMIMNSNKS